MGETRDTAAARRDAPWIMRTYAGHSTAGASNALYRANLARGQTGLSVAFDLPTQTGYDALAPEARGEVGKVGVPVAHLGDMRRLFDGIPLERMNTSMTINATAPWLMALYVTVADEQGADRTRLSGTTQNDIIKEYLSRGTYVFPPAPSLRLSTDLIAWTARETPKWNPVNICSYHLQEAGATPVQEIAFALAAAIAILDGMRASGAFTADDFPAAVGRLSFFVNAGMRFVTEIAKLTAFGELWDELLEQRYGVADARHRRFRYGVQVNSLGLTEPQPENNVARILIEMLGVVLSRNARARAVQLPAWNEALGLPRPIDQQWSLRMQQIMALETDLLEHEDIFAGSAVMAAKVAALKAGAAAELARIEAMGGAVAAVEAGYMKSALVAENARRLAEIERGVRTVVGVNAFTDSEPSPLAGGAGAVLTVPEEVEADAARELAVWLARRDSAAAAAALDELRRAAAEGRNIMEPSLACARAGVTTGEWGATLRDVFGQYRPPTGIDIAIAAAEDDDEAAVRALVDRLAARLERPPTLVMGKPGLDGHSNGAEQIAVRARDCGFEVVYDGIRLTPADIVRRVADSRAHVLGLSILSGSHLPLVREVMGRLREAGLGHLPVVVGGIIPDDDALALRQMGVRAVYTPKDFRLTRIVGDLAAIVDRTTAESAVAAVHP